jgi:hypothetical protein
MATKPTKQQVAQAKARAGGNNPVKVTNAGLRKLGSAAVIAASLTPAGRVARGAATVAKAAKAEGVMAKAGWNKAAKESYRASVKRGTYATPKSGVKVKPAAKQKPNKPNEAKAFAKSNDSMGRAYNKALREYNSMPEAGRFGSAAEAQANARDAAFAGPMARKASIAIKKLTDAEKRKATTPTRTPAKPARGTVRINSAKTTRVVKVSPKKK